jgi:hypothetical protein
VRLGTEKVSVRKIARFSSQLVGVETLLLKGRLARMLPGGGESVYRYLTVRLHFTTVGQPEGSQSNVCVMQTEFGGLRKVVWVSWCLRGLGVRLRPVQLNQVEV